MRFLLYNIRYGTGRSASHSMVSYLRSTEKHLSEITRFIQSVNPDVTGLVEVDSGSYRTGRRNQAEEIARALGHTHAYRSKYSVNSFTQWVPVFRSLGNAFLAKETQTDAKFHYFRKGMKKLIIELELDSVVFLLVHLALGGRVRHGQLTDLFDLVQSIRKPVIVAGDFNTLWGEREIKLFQAATGLRNANEANLPTYPSWRPKRHLDFIMYSPHIALRSFKMPSVTLSDHLPLVIDFDVTAPAPAKRSAPS